MKKLVKFIRECVLELKKVTWPSKEEIIVSTKVVVISVIIISIILGLLDFLFFSGVNRLLIR